MSLLPNPDSCCSVCDPEPVVQIPGPAGSDGSPGADGTGGIDAFSVASSFIMPTYLGNVSVLMDSSEWMQIGQKVFASGGAFSGTLQVVSKADSTHATLQNLDDNAGAYADNSPPTSVFPNGTGISPGGDQGQMGPAVPGGTYFAIANNLNEGTPATMRSNLGLGSAALFTQGVANGNIPNIQDAGGIGANEFVTGTGLGIQGRTAAQARSDLGLGTAAVVDTGVADTKIPTVNLGGGLVSGDAVFATASGVKTLTASAARAALGISTAFDMLLFRQEESDGTNGGNFSNGAWRTVPLNTEVVDTGNNGSIATNQITLAAGTYRYRFAVVGFLVDQFQGRIFNVTDAAVVASSYGSIAQSDPGLNNTNYSLGEGRFTIVAIKVLTLQGRCVTSNTTGDGFGTAAGFGVGEVYSWIELWKE